MSQLQQEGDEEEKEGNWTVGVAVIAVLPYHHLIVFIITIIVNGIVIIVIFVIIIVHLNMVSSRFVLPPS